MPGKTAQAPQKQIKPLILNDNLTQQSVFSKLAKNYHHQADDVTKFLDVFMVFCIFTGVTQFIYFSLNGSYQYNAFLGGFCSSVGSFVLTAILRLKTTGPSDVLINWERLIAEFIFGAVILNLFIANFLA